ncbi:bifunctional 3-(3-hydroxy-phenyl)propionate/3-hydroxycinnamic acid hydroxylase [Nonomuraea sp. FMUSA5-5]|uniref:Bifunctional 3-(3-hydroxy-phenyl)propionate/3-hydroxycinnamic acid hydroxylase n=1 Tax=Nonomuraea composti TaxID=2720023 RepID=A0ABX1BJF9_9ACTN|nr:bifunctional 3-(3-hydroxy-phenyl)propionate/3-hydroxycinnamic acid hydroxylase [Nonomuraea sp. FMUSA5-5]
MSRLPVLVVGAGPVGLTVANLLAARQVPVLVVERNATTSDEAKAISLDDESLRTMQMAGLDDAVLEIVVPGTGTRYFGRTGKVLFHARGPEPYRMGFPFKNQFAQPELERVLLRALKNRPDVEVRFGTALVGLHEGEVVTAVLESGEAEVGWVLGCDGGRSTVRELKKIGMAGTSHSEVWLVVDTVGDAHDQRYAMHLGTPSRPTVVVPGRNGRCRYEFRLWPGEGVAGERPEFELIRRLLSPYRDISPAQVERSVTYTFNALVADRWRDGRSFLLGDAAHMMPPFAGQGLNSGIRDAANLAWKLAEVWHGRCDPSLLDTYELERRPHATATVALSQRLGQVVMTTSRPRAWLRDMMIRAIRLTGPGRRYLAEMRFRPRAVHRQGVVSGNGDLVGTLLPQPCVLVASSARPVLLDEVLGAGFALLGVDVTAAEWDRVASLLPADRLVTCVDVVLDERLPRPSDERQSVADADGRLQAALGMARGHFVLVRPDRYLGAVFTAERAGPVGDLLGACVR